jgi:hypothetical protein
MRKIIAGLSAAALTVGLGGCATVTRGTSEQFTINTTPPGAQAHTSNGFNCESTPCSIRMPRKDGFTITVTKAGYKQSITDVTPKLAATGAAGFVGNALIGGVIGAAVDVGTGSTMDLTPNPLNVTLEAIAAPAAAAPAMPAKEAPPAAQAKTASVDAPSQTAKP